MLFAFTMSGRRIACPFGGVKSVSRLRSLPRDPEKSARFAGLHYTSDHGAGYGRIASGKGFRYTDTDGKTIRDTRELKRIRSLVIPPAWKNVWICPDAFGHLQAVGFDARGRKQYRYHPSYRAVRNLTKFHCMPEVVQGIALVRERIRNHLSLPGMPQEKVLAALIRMLDITGIRIGNEQSASENKTFGLTTLCNRHVDIDGGTLVFHFTGKSGVKHELKIADRRLAHIVRQCHHLPGQRLFEYMDESGEPRAVSSTDVNRYLAELSGQELTAKDFRTWAGTVECAIALRSIGEFSSETEARKNVVAAIRVAAERLGNRLATCRTYYVHPAVIEAYLAGDLLPVMRHATEPKGMLSADEEAVLKITQRYRHSLEQNAVGAICA
jgi:DNA topoisomerase-1